MNDDSFDPIWTETEHLASKESISRSPPTIPRIRTIPSKLGDNESSRNVASYSELIFIFLYIRYNFYDIKTKFT
jgi:hypothetical protein